MDNNEIITNEEVVEIASEENAQVCLKKSFKVAAGIGLAAIAGMIVYKYAAKPILAKIKANKEQSESSQVIIIDNDEVVVENDKESGDEES